MNIEKTAKTVPFENLCIIENKNEGLMMKKNPVKYEKNILNSKNHK